MWLLLIGVIIGFLLGHAGARLSWYRQQQASAVRLEVIAIALVEARKAELLYLEELRDAVLAVQGRRVH